MNYLAILLLIIAFLPASSNADKAGSNNLYSVEDAYMRAMQLYENGEYSKAKAQLENIISIDPSFLPAKEGLLSIYFEEMDWDNAYLLSLDILQYDKCNKKARKSLTLIAKKWYQNNNRLPESVIIYQHLLACDKNNVDLMFYFARALYRNGNLTKANEVLQNVLRRSSGYTDAKILIGYITMQEGDYKAAEEIFSQFPKNPDAVEGLRILKARKNGSMPPEHRLQKARKHHHNLDFTEAQEEYEWIYQNSPDSFDLWPSLFDVKSHTRPSIVQRATYTEAKEDDPNLQEPVVKNYYFLDTVDLRLPVVDQWRIDLRGIYYHQRENDIFPPVGVNYTAYIGGLELISRVFFAHYWRWDLFAKGIKAWGRESNVNFPFNDTERLEPGTTLFYNDNTHLFAANVHRESFIIKNFDTSRSTLLRTDYAMGGYSYTLDSKVKLKLREWTTFVKIHDRLHNWKIAQEFYTSLNLPIFLFKYFTFSYLFEFEHFDQLNRNYYSYDKQYKNTIGIEFFVNFTENFYWRLLFEYREKVTMDLFQPIGIFILVQERQKLFAYKGTSSIGYSFQDHIRLELGGHYFYETLPYRDWNAYGKLVMQF